MQHINISSSIAVYNNANIHRKDITMNKDKFDSYDFLINEDDEVMLLLYAKESKPEDAYMVVDFDNKSAELYRNANDCVVINDISEDILSALQLEDSILVCELSRDEGKEPKMIYAYEAQIEI